MPKRRIPDDIPAHLRARPYPKNILRQEAENQRIERLALAEAIRTDLAVFFMPSWWVDGVDDSEEQMIWPNGEVQSAASYAEELRQWRLAKNWHGGDDLDDDGWDDGRDDDRPAEAIPADDGDSLDDMPF